MQRMPEIYQSSIIEAIRNLPKVYNKILPFERAISVIEQFGTIKYDFSQISTLQKKLPEINAALRTTNVLLAAIDGSNAFSHAIKQSGGFDAISSISRNMPVLEAINKLNIILPIVEPLDYDISCSNECDIIVDDVILFKDEIFEIAEEFQSAEILLIKQRFEQLENKKSVK